MAITVRTNTTASAANNDLSRTSRALSRSFERISTGKRIARAADDAAGLGVAENLRAASSSAAVAARNTNDGISMIAVAEGATNEVANILIRMRELAVQSSSGTLANAERAYIQTEFTELSEEVDRISASTEFNGTVLTNTTNGLTVNVQVGLNNSATVDQISISFGDLTATTLGVNNALNLGTATTAGAALVAIDTALGSVNTYRATYGAVENRLGSALNNLETFRQTTLEAESRIRDADFGAETAELAQNQILQQAGVSVLSQAKTLNQAALSLLQ